LNEAVLLYLEVERVAPPGTTGPWVIDGYSLSTHPDLCDRVKEINEAAGEPATFRYLYGKPALVAENGVIVAFAAGTYIFCVHALQSDVDPRLVADHGPALGQAWTCVEPWPVEIPKDEGLAQLAGLMRVAVSRLDSSSWQTQPDS